MLFLLGPRIHDVGDRGGEAHIAAHARHLLRETGDVVDLLELIEDAILAAIVSLPLTDGLKCASSAPVDDAEDFDEAER